MKKKLYWKAGTTTILSIALSSVPSVEINFLSQGLVVTFDQIYTPDANLAIHYSNVTMSILSSQIAGNPTVCLTVCLDLYKK